jgi:small subunit ribosomal protein S8
MMTDPISDMLTRIRNAAMARKAEIRLPYSKIKLAIAKILAEQGYIASVSKTDGVISELVLSLSFNGKEPVIRFVKRISKPGQRVYAPYADLPNVLSGHGIAIVSTSQGIMTNLEARKRRLGGEVLCEVY